jgi:RsiW-degrading membrane proteinase PrsW (M82 family)
LPGTITFMNYDVLLAALVGLLPAVVFLAALVFFDSYKLVSIKFILVTMALGALAALLSYFCNDAALAATGLSNKIFSRYLAPVIEESLKAAILVYLLRSNRVGFLVDAAILGFSVGAGFAILENFYYLQNLVGSPLGIWIVRGFGTAIMHGGVAAIFTVTTLALSDHKTTAGFLDILPGLFLAILTHSLYNHFPLSPPLSTLVVLVVLPMLGIFIFKVSEDSVARWLNAGFDADAELLEIITSGEISESHAGKYLENLKQHFRPEIVFDMICYLRLYTELALRAKGMLMMRESGFEVETGPEVQASLDELRCLEESIGVTGRLALKPFLHLSRKDLWQLYMLEK